MPVPSIIGIRNWTATRDENGFVDYKLTLRVQGNFGDGPANILNNTPGLPTYGTPWIVPTLNSAAVVPFDADIWAWFRWNADVKPVVDAEINDLFDVTLTASNRWPSIRDGDRPFANDPPTDPRLDPPKISGSFIRYTEEAVQDRFGNFITNSAYELIRGPHAEFDRNRPQIKIEFNSALLPLSYMTLMVDTVNAYPLWGLPPRTIKLSEANWELKYASQGDYYYGLSFVFDINFGTWDRNLLDEGTKALNGDWDQTTGNYVLIPINGQPPDPQNPQHFCRFKDRRGDPTTVVLDGIGLPSSVNIGTGSVTASTTKAYMCTVLNNITAPPGVGWVPVVIPIATKSSWWTLNTFYRTGAVVSYIPSLPAGQVVDVVTYLAIQNSLSSSLNAPGLAPNIWVQVPSGFLPRDLGEWQGPSSPTGARNYTIGDIVHTVITITLPTTFDSGPPGIIHVEKYAESDFTLLGIPLSFPLAF